jgi:hypothetical protein
MDFVFMRTWFVRNFLPIRKAGFLRGSKSVIGISAQPKLGQRRQNPKSLRSRRHSHR